MIAEVKVSSSKVVLAVLQPTASEVTVEEQRTHAIMEIIKGAMAVQVSRQALNKNRQQSGE
jgi:hypothetical protein